MKNINDLRAHLFDTIEGLKAGTMKIETAKAINECAQVMVNSAKVEADMMDATGLKGSGFVPDDKLPAISAEQRLRLARN